MSWILRPFRFFYELTYPFGRRIRWNQTGVVHFGSTTYWREILYGLMSKYLGKRLKEQAAKWMARLDSRWSGNGMPKLFFTDERIMPLLFMISRSGVSYF
jgi:hypothetical protein